MVRHGTENPISLGKEPKIKLYYPDWWYGHGNKMQVSEEERDKTNKRLVIKGSAAEVVITRREDISNRKEWLVDYRIIHCSDVQFSSGRTTMSERELSAAFAINSDDPGEGESLLDQYGGDSASQGTYIRYKRFLNIPGPGTSRNGDPNVSIEITDEIKLGVSKLLFG